MLTLTSNFVYYYIPFCIFIVSLVINLSYIISYSKFSSSKLSNKYNYNIEYTNSYINRINVNSYNNYNCTIPEKIIPKIYLYALPDDLNEIPRKKWYEMWYKEKYDPNTLNFAFGKKFYTNKEISSDPSLKKYKDYYFTHMHSLEIYLNERFKVELKNHKYNNKWFTDNPNDAQLFIIPFPFALDYRMHTKDSWSQVEYIHGKLQNYLLTSNNIWKNNINKKMHVILFGRIAYETGQMTRRGSPFWNDSLYYVLSIDRNCHGDVRSCFTRISMPHPSSFHPKDLNGLKLQIERSKSSKRNILVSFCGAVRTPTRKHAEAICNKQRRGGWWYKWFDGELCKFIDSQKEDDKLKQSMKITSQGERRRRIELKFSQQCIDLYYNSVFCLQEGADSSTRKGLWDGMIAGCIPIFIHGVMQNEFECIGKINHPWYLIVHNDYYIKQLLSLPKEYINMLRYNILKMIPKLLYTNGNSGFNDAFDSIMACLLRYSYYLNNKNCNYKEMLERQWFNTENMLGYNKLYNELGL